MGRQEVIAERADVAAQVSFLMSDPDFYSDLIKKNILDSDGTIPMVITGEFESAIIAMNRFERMGVERVVLATNKGSGKIEIVGLQKTRGSSDSNSRRVLDIVGGITVRDWINLMVEDPERAYTMTGSDVLPFAEARQYASAHAEPAGSYR